MLSCMPTRLIGIVSSSFQALPTSPSIPPVADGTGERIARRRFGVSSAFTSDGHFGRGPAFFPDRLVVQQTIDSPLRTLRTLRVHDGFVSVEGYELSRVDDILTFSVSLANSTLSAVNGYKSECGKEEGRMTTGARSWDDMSKEEARRRIERMLTPEIDCSAGPAAGIGAVGPILW